MSGHVENELHMSKTFYRDVVLISYVPTYSKSINATLTQCVFSRGFHLLAATFACPFEVEITQFGNFAFFV